MNWSNLTVEQYQKVYEVSKLKLPEEDASVKLLCVLHNKTEDEINEMSLKQFNEECSKLSFLFTDKIPGGHKNIIKVNKHKYCLIYDLDKIKQRQYAEVKYFIQGGVIENLHKILASIVRPATWLKLKPNKAEDVLIYSNDLLKARFIDVYHSCLFFCRLYRNSMIALKTYLVEEMALKMSRQQAERSYQVLINSLDGFITHA